MIRSIGLVVHEGKQAAVDAGRAVAGWAQARTLPCTPIDVWQVDGRSGRLHAAEEAARAGHPDLVVTVGGDGTFLRGVRVAAPIGAMVLGVDVGRVGFLTEISVGDLERALDAVLAGEFQVDARLMLTMRASRQLEIPAGIEGLLRYGRGPTLPSPQIRAGLAEDVGWGVPLDIHALNDVVFEKLARDRQASLAVYVNGRMFASYSADAVIVSTPTGSTAYSYAAGGPVLSPDMDALVFTPVAPHMTFNRSIILGVKDRVGVLVHDHSGQVAVSVDGALRGVLDPGDWITVYAGPRRARLARLSSPDFLGRVRGRLGLADAPAALADGGSAPEVFAPAQPLPADLADPGPHD